MTRLSKLKISWRRRKQYTSPVTLGERHNEVVRYIYIYILYGTILPINEWNNFQIQLDIDPRRDDDASLMSSRPSYLNVDFSSSAQVKIQCQTFWKKIQNFGFSSGSTREDLFIDVSITNVGLILTKLWWFPFSGYGQTRFCNPHMETCRHTKNFKSKLQISA